jgi:hypothetical protein
MNRNRETKYERRDILAGAARYVALGAMAVLGAAAIVKRRRLAGAGVCIKNGACTGCSVLAECSLPEASRLKEAKR